MNDRPDTAPGGRGEAAAAGPEGGPWLDERAALAVVTRLRPELSPEEAEGQLLVFHCFGRTRHEEPPSPSGNGAAAADRHVPRFHYNDLVRWFVQLPVPAPRRDPFFDNLRPGGSSRDLPQPVVGSVAALRHVRLAHPDSTEYERKALLWEAMRAGRISVWWPPGTMIERRGADGQHAPWAATERFWEEALFSEPTVTRAFPSAALPGETTAAGGAEAGVRDARAFASGWLPLPLARGEVARTTGLPEAAAAEWLRGETLAGRIRARYPARAQRGLEATFHDEAAVRSRGAAGDKDGGWCAFYSVADHIERGPQMMSEHYVVAAEWHAGELRAALARQFPAGGGRGLSGGEPEPHGRAARTGRKPKDFWPKVLGYAAGWLAERGEAPNRQSELEDVILERIEVLGGEAERSTVRSYAREMLAGYRAQLDDE